MFISASYCIFIYQDLPATQINVITIPMPMKDVLTDESVWVGRGMKMKKKITLDEARENETKACKEGKIAHDIPNEYPKMSGSHARAFLLDRGQNNLSAQLS